MTHFYSLSVLVFQTSNPIDVAGRPGTVHHTLLQKTPGVGNTISPSFELLWIYSKQSDCSLKKIIIREQLTSKLAFQDSESAVRTGFSFIGETTVASTSHECKEMH